jgi:hypothetical protein
VPPDRPLGELLESVAVTRQLVDALINLLQVGCDLSAAVFASSIDEPGIAQGQPFVLTVPGRLLVGAALTGPPLSAAPTGRAGSPPGSGTSGPERPYRELPVEDTVRRSSRPDRLSAVVLR